MPPFVHHPVENYYKPKALTAPEMDSIPYLEEVCKLPTVQLGRKDSHQTCRTHISAPEFLSGKPHPHSLVCLLRPHTRPRQQRSIVQSWQKRGSQAWPHPVHCSLKTEKGHPLVSKMPPFSAHFWDVRKTSKCYLPLSPQSKCTDK